MWRMFPFVLIPLAAIAAGAARRAAWGTRRAAWSIRPEREPRHWHRRGHSLFGLLWVAFWVCFGLAIAFGGPETRHAILGTIRSLTLAVVEFFRELFGAGVQ
jgi:hypothetical protein